MINGLSSRLDDLLNPPTGERSNFGLCVHPTVQAEMGFSRPQGSCLCFVNGKCSGHHVLCNRLRQRLVSSVQCSLQMMIMGMVLRLARLGSLSQLLVTRKVQWRSRSCTTWITPPRNCLVCGHVKAAFVKYNTTLSSSAPVQRFDCFTAKK